MTIKNLKTEHKNIHFVGIGGISMSGLAEILHRSGFNISGSDGKSSDATEHLKELGISVCIGHAAESIPCETDLVVYTAAVKPDNVELMEAARRGIKTIDRACLLGVMMHGYRRPVCVSGTHGKTSTTSMISQIFLDAGVDPSIMLGGIMPSINASFRKGAEDFFVVESCEYFDSFLKFYPYAGVILNVEEDHLDYFKDIDHIEDSFHRFAKNISSQGFLVINSEIPGFKKITEGLECRIITYAGPKANWRAADISYDKLGCAAFTVIYEGNPLARLSLNLRGEHNIQNALAAYAVAHNFNIPAEIIKSSLDSFQGAKRRFEYKGEVNGVNIVDDYAHHPTEIRATLAAAKNCSYNKLYAVFQPHTFSRTKMLLKSLSESFDDADVVVILDIYSAREVDTGEIHSKELAEMISKRKKNVYYFSSFQEAKKFLYQNCIPKDLLITMGAGDVHLLGEEMLEK